MNPKVNKVSQCLKQQFVRECYKSRNKLLLAIQLNKFRPRLERAELEQQSK